MPITRFLMDPDDGNNVSDLVSDILGQTSDNTEDTSTTNGGTDNDTEDTTTESDEEKQQELEQTADDIVNEQFTFFITSLNSAHSKHKRIKVVGSIESYSDSFSVTTTSDNAYGRIDPIYTYTGTTRTISFSVLMDTILNQKGKPDLEQNRQSGMETARKIASTLYPSYSDPMGSGLDTSTLKAPPLVKIDWTNYINGVVGYRTSFSYDINTDRGTTLILTKDGELENQPAGVVINITFQPIHTKEGGFSSNGIEKTSNWPLKP